MSGKQAALFTLFMVILITLCFTVIFPFIAEKKTQSQKEDSGTSQKDTLTEFPKQTPATIADKNPQSQKEEGETIRNGAVAESPNQIAPSITERNIQLQKEGSVKIRKGTMAESPKSPNHYAPSATSSRP